MPESSQSGTATVLPWLALVVLVPVAVGIGWGIAHVPGPASQAPAEAVQSPSTSAPAVSPAVTATIRTGEDARREPSAWTTFDRALAESQRTGKPVLIDFNAEWCPPCQRMKQELFDDGSMGREVQSAVVPVSIVDRRREDGRNPPEIESLQQRFDVRAFPTLIVFSPATGRTEKTQGFGDARRTLTWITEAATSVR